MARMSRFQKELSGQLGEKWQRKRCSRMMSGSILYKIPGERRVRNER